MGRIERGTSSHDSLPGRVETGFDLGSHEYGFDYERRGATGLPGLLFTNKTLAFGVALAQEMAKGDVEKFAHMAKSTNYQMATKVIVGIVERHAALKNSNPQSILGVLAYSKIYKSVELQKKSDRVSNMISGVEITDTDCLVYMTSMDDHTEVISLLSLMKGDLTAEARKQGTLWKDGETVTTIFDRDALSGAEQSSMGGYNITTPSSVMVSMKLEMSSTDRLDFGKKTGLVDGNGLMYLGIETRNGVRQALFYSISGWNPDLPSEALPPGSSMVGFPANARICSLDRIALAQMHGVLKLQGISSEHVKRAMRELA